MNRLFDGDPMIEKLRREHPLKGPDPKRGESLEKWAERYLDYVRRKHREDNQNGNS